MTFAPTIDRAPETAAGPTAQCPLDRSFPQVTPEEGSRNSGESGRGDGRPHDIHCEKEAT